LRDLARSLLVRLNLEEKRMNHDLVEKAALRPAAA
jgi:hypothetical protein